MMGNTYLDSVSPLSEMVGAIESCGALRTRRRVGFVQGGSVVLVDEAERGDGIIESSTENLAVTMMWARCWL